MANPQEWISLHEFSRRWNRPYSTVKRMARDGTLLAFGIRVHSTLPILQGLPRTFVEVPVKGSSSIDALTLNQRC